MYDLFLQIGISLFRPRRNILIFQSILGVKDILELFLVIAHYKITNYKIVREFWLVKNLWFIVPVDSEKT